MKRLPAVIYFIICVSSGCLRHEYKKPISNGFFLYAYAADEDMTIAYFDKYGGFEIVNPTVFSIGYNKDFIIAKQHPTVYPEKENKKVTNYFIISLKQSVSWKSGDNATGPLTEKEFLTMRKKLNIPDTLTFTITFDSIK